MNMLIYKIHNTYLNMLTLTINETCMDDEKIKRSCLAI